MSQESWQKNKRTFRKENGLCTYCNEPVVMGLTQCAFHRTYANLLKRNLTLETIELIKNYIIKNSKEN